MDESFFTNKVAEFEGRFSNRLSRPTDLVSGDTTIKSKWVNSLPWDGRTASSRRSCLHCSMPFYDVFWSCQVSGKTFMEYSGWFCFHYCHTGVSLASHRFMSLRQSFEPVSREALLWNPSACLSTSKMKSISNEYPVCGRYHVPIKSLARIMLHNCHHYLIKWTFLVRSAMNIEKPELGGPIENWKESPSMLLYDLWLVNALSDSFPPRTVNWRLIWDLSASNRVIVLLHRSLDVSTVRVIFCTYAQVYVLIVDVSCMSLKLMLMSWDPSKRSHSVSSFDPVIGTPFRIPSQCWFLSPDR